LLNEQEETKASSLEGLAIREAERRSSRHPAEREQASEKLSSVGAAREQTF